MTFWNRARLLLLPLLLQAGDFAECLERSYPDFIVAVQCNRVFFSDGTSLPYDDGLDKNLSQLLENPDIEDMGKMPYPPASTATPWGDPGRIRNTPFFQKLYGNSESEVKAHVREIRWMPKSGGATLKVTTQNGVDKKLESISAQLDALPEPLKPYVLHPSGGFYWREIAGTQRLSMHSFGIAVDIDQNLTRYWRWDKNRATPPPALPEQIVEIFEHHGFIWGGRWHHYDTMHFEYRPELFCR